MWRKKKLVGMTPREAQMSMYWRSKENGGCGGSVKVEVHTVGNGTYMTEPRTYNRKAWKLKQITHWLTVQIEISFIARAELFFSPSQNVCFWKSENDKHNVVTRYFWFRYERECVSWDLVHQENPSYTKKFCLFVMMQWIGKLCFTDARMKLVSALCISFRKRHKNRKCQAIVKWIR